MDPVAAAILVVDRHGRYTHAIAGALTAEGYRVKSVATTRSARRVAARMHFHVVIASPDSEHSEGAALISALRELSADTQFILVGEGGSMRAALDAMRQGAFDCLAWPVSGDQILRSVRRALEQQSRVARDRGVRRPLEWRDEVDVFVGTSVEMKEAQRLIEQVAPTDVTVLIEGESGTGKELAARALHERSRRRAGPFVAVNCAALPESLIESELFGHVRGAFTGAIADKPGRFELARDGTLFLDEVGDLSRLGQADLLRVLEDGVFRPIGSRALVRANARVVAATNKELDRQCAQGAFREDLLYRLNVITIRLPPLRERPQDIPPLVEMFRAHFAAKHGRRGPRFDGAALRALAAFGWPGNVRQLRNVVERIVLTAPAARIDASHLPAFVRQEPVEPEHSMPPGMTLARVEEDLIRQTLSRAGGNRTRAAGMLGISRRALHYKLKRMQPEG